MTRGRPSPPTTVEMAPLAAPSLPSPPPAQASVPRPFPWKGVWLVYAVVVANAIAFTGVTSFLPEMVVEQFGFAEDDAGRAVGMLGGAFSLASFLSSFGLGYLSDRFGRKPLLLSGLLIPAVLLAAFGLSPSFGWAIANRAVEGFTNSNLAISKAYLSDVITDHHRALAFGYLGACFSAARILSAAAAGALAEVFPHGSWLRFSFPCFLLAPPLLMTFAAVWLLLPESAPNAAVRRGNHASVNTDGARRLKLSVVQVDLSSSEDEVDDDGDSPQSQSAGDIGSAVLSSTPPPSQAPSPVSATLVTDDDRCKLMDAAADRSDDSDCESGEGGKAAVPLPPLSLRQGFRVIFRDHPTVMVMLLFCVNSFCNGGILLCDVLFMALPVAHLGLGFSPATIGVANSVFGVFALSFQMFAVKPLLRRLSPLQAYRRIGTVSLGIGSALLPIAALPLAATRCIVPEGPNVTAVSALARAASFAHAGGVHGVHRLLTQNAPEVVPCGDFDLAWLSWGIAFLALAFQAIGFMTCLPMVHTFMSNVAYAEIQGLTQGTASSFAALLRAIGPMVTGAVFSATASVRQPFWASAVLACGYFASFISSFWLDKQLVENKRRGAAPRWST